MTLTEACSNSVALQTDFHIVVSWQSGCFKRRAVNAVKHWFLEAHIAVSQNIPKIEKNGT